MQNFSNQKSPASAGRNYREATTVIYMIPINCQVLRLETGAKNQCLASAKGAGAFITEKKIAITTIAAIKRRVKFSGSFVNIYSSDFRCLAEYKENTGRFDERMQC